MARVDSTVGQIFDIFRPEKKIVATVAQRIGDAGAFTVLSESDEYLTPGFRYFIRLATESITCVR